jgi:hypothetical protein
MKRLLLMSALLLSACGSGDTTVDDAALRAQCIDAIPFLTREAERVVPPETPDMPVNRRYNEVCQLLVDRIARNVESPGDIECFNVARSQCPSLPEYSRPTTLIPTHLPSRPR